MDRRVSQTSTYSGFEGADDHSDDEFTPAPQTTVWERDDDVTDVTDVQQDAHEGVQQYYEAWEYQ